MRDDRAHYVYGVAVAVALALGFAAGFATHAAVSPAREPLPDNFADRFYQVEQDCRVVMKRQQLLLRKFIPEEEWIHGR